MAADASAHTVRPDPEKWDIELPLTGPAYFLADAAYKAYDIGDYRRAERKAREAMRLRPDVKRLRDLHAKAQAALRSPAKGTATAARSVRRHRPSSQTIQTAQAIQPGSNPAFSAADAAYKAYDPVNGS